MNTPLFDALCAFEKQNTLRMHMPGHKGKPLNAVFGDLNAIDFTEIGPTGNLYSCEGIIAQVEKLAAAAWGCANLSFCTNGATGAIQTALRLACPAGSSLAMERSCHRSVYNAVALWDLRPVYMSDPTPESVEQSLAGNVGLSAVCITSPDYFGRCKDISGISRVCRAHGVKLIVDEAHGAHLPFMEGFSGAVSQGADLSCTSFHKTLPALGQCAALTSNDGFSPKTIKTALTVTNTSSPSYPLMASMDLARAYMQEQGRAEYARAAARVSELRRDVPSLCDGTLDPCRFVLVCKDGFAVEENLEAQGIFCEMADERHVVFITTGLDSDDDFIRLRRALVGLGGLLGGPGGFAPPPQSKQCMTPGNAFRAVKHLVPLDKAVGAVCAQIVAPYPPAQPVITYGEEISQKHIAYLIKKRYNIREEIFVVEPQNGL